MGFISRQLPKVIEWTDDSKNTLVYRYPMEGREVMKGSQLTVRESQAAIVVDQGKIADVFTAGRYKLDSNNLPILTKLRSWKYGWDSPFKVDIYFINTRQFTGIKWGTVNPISMRDKDFGVIRVRGFGVYAFRVNNPELFLRDVFGSNSQYRLSDITEHLKSVIVSGLSDIIGESGISAVDLAGNLNEFNEHAKKLLQSKFNELGLLLTNMTVENLSFPDAVEKALDERTTVGIMSDKMASYVQMKTVEAMNTAAANQSTPGMFMGMGVGNQFGNSFGVLENAKDAPSKAGTAFCSECGAKFAKGAKFCPECGKRQSSANTCSSCGAQVTAGAKFCPECGKRL